MKLTLVLASATGCRAGRAAQLDDVRRRPALLLLGAFGRMEDRDLADVRFAEVRADAVDEHALADRQRRFHRAAGNPVGLDDQRLDPEREAERDGDDHDQLDDRAGRRFRLLAPSSRQRCIGGDVRRSSARRLPRLAPRACIAGSAATRRRLARLGAGTRSSASPAPQASGSSGRAPRDRRPARAQPAQPRPAHRLPSAARSPRPLPRLPSRPPASPRRRLAPSRDRLLGGHAVRVGRPALLVQQARLDRLLRDRCSGARARARACRRGRAGSRASRGARRRARPARCARSSASAPGTCARRRRRRTACAP